MLEKREWRRIDVKLAAKVQSSAASKVVSVDVININPMGFCFFSEKGFEEGDQLDISVDLTGVGVAKLKTEVAWSGFLRKEKTYSTGIRVIEKNLDELEKFFTFYNVKLLQSAGNA